MSWQGGIPPGHGWGQPPNPMMQGMHGDGQSGYPGYPPYSDQQNGQQNWGQPHPGQPHPGYPGPENGHFPMTSQFQGYPGMPGNPYGMGAPGFPGQPSPYGHPGSGFPPTSMQGNPSVQSSMAQMQAGAGFPGMPSNFPGSGPTAFPASSQPPQRPRPSSTNVTNVYKQSMASSAESQPQQPVHNGAAQNPMYTQASIDFSGQPRPHAPIGQPRPGPEVKSPPPVPVPQVVKQQAPSPMPDFSFNNRSAPSSFIRAPAPTMMNGTQLPGQAPPPVQPTMPQVPSLPITRPRVDPTGFNPLSSMPPSMASGTVHQLQPTPTPLQLAQPQVQRYPPPMSQSPNHINQQQAPPVTQLQVPMPPLVQQPVKQKPQPPLEPAQLTPMMGQPIRSPQSQQQLHTHTAAAAAPKVASVAQIPSSPPKPPQLQHKPISPNETPTKPNVEGPPELTPPKPKPQPMLDVPEFSDSDGDEDEKANGVDELTAKLSSDDEDKGEENSEFNETDDVETELKIDDCKVDISDDEDDEEAEEDRRQKRILLEKTLKEQSELAKMEIDEPKDEPEDHQDGSNGGDTLMEPESNENSKKRKREKNPQKDKQERGITREAAAAAAAALVSDADVEASNYRTSDSSNDAAADGDFDVDEGYKEKKSKPRGKPKVPATIIGTAKKKKKYDFQDEDEIRSKKKKRRKIDSEDEFITPEDLIEKRRSGRSSRGAPKNYDDNAVPNFSDQDSDDDGPMKKRGRKKKESVDTSEEGIHEPIAEIAEEPLIVDKILSHRIVKRKKSSDGSDDEAKKDEADENSEHKHEVSKPDQEEEEEEFFIKWKGYSYIHCVWLFKDEIFDPRFDQKMRRYYMKLGAANAPDPDNEDIFNPDFVIVDRVLDCVEGTDQETGNPTRHFLVKWCGLAYDECTWELEADVDEFKIDWFRKYNKRKSHKRPTERPPLVNWRKLDHPQRFKNDCELRDYQVEGVSWLLFNWYQKRNCILADEMGLGKTIQSITFMQKVYETNHKGPYLIVVPLSTVGNWIREFETWTDLNAIVYHGSAQSRQMIHQYELYQRDKKGYPKRGEFRFDALITTYEMIVADIAEIRNVNWQLMIIDEAHRLKNTKSKLAENLKHMHIGHKVLLTGTPLQNNIEELYALLNFMNPIDFYDIGIFMRDYGVLTNKEHVEKMQKVLKPIMLRRLKEDVEKSLAPKEETIIEVELTNIQKKYYRAILERNFDFLSKGASSGNVPSLMNTMMELRKCCNHPFLIKGAEDKILDEYRAKGEDVSPLTAIVQASGKMVLIHKLLPKLKSGGHKVLIFSQMIRVLDILEDYLCQMSMGFERLDGRIRGNDRQAAIDRFCKPDSDRFVFLLCTRAGGLGINLTAADTVIIFDSDWNPQNDLQAQARCHRIGQTKEVKIYRLLTSKTYEREMFDRASLKLGLDRAVLQSMSGTSGKDSGGGPMNSLSKKEVEDLLKKGAYGALMDDDDAAEKFCEEDIDQILSNRATTVKHEGGVKGSTFSKATFAGAAENRMDIDINDPDFWEKWARKADLDLEALNANKLIIEQPRVRKQTQRYNPEFDEHALGEIGSETDSDNDNKKRRVGWDRKESFKLQKGLLMFGWGRWNDIVEHCQLSKKFPEREVEDVARAILTLAASCYNGDDKVKQFIWELITPPEYAHELHLHNSTVRQTKKSKRGRDSESPPPLDEGREWVIQLDGLLVDDQFRKHVVTHANKLLGRVRVLSYLRTEILADWLDHIKDDVPATEYELDVPNIEGDPPVPWWDEEADKSLLVGIFKHGYDRYSLIRNDQSLVFLPKVGPADDKALMADLMEGESKPTLGDGDKEYRPKQKNLFGDQDQIIEGANQTPPQSDPSHDGATNASPNKSPTTEMTPEIQVASKPTSPSEGDYKSEGDDLKPVEGEEQADLAKEDQKFEPWPTVTDLNKRFRMIIAAYQRIFRRAAARAQRMNKNRIQRQITERWTKREESDFYRAVSTFGTEMLQSGNFNWEKFRMVAKLDKKSDTSLTNYYIAFRAMCERTCRRSTIPDEDLPAVYVEQISEDRASRTLMRIQLLDRIRRECLVHPKLDDRLKLCQKSPDLPIWWKAGSHDKELLVGLHKHGLSRGEIHILNDAELTFGDVMKSAQKLSPRIKVKSSPEEVIKNEVNSYGETSSDEKPVDPEAPVGASQKDELFTATEPKSEHKELKRLSSEHLVETEPEPEGPIVEVATEEEKQLLESEYIQQQSLNRWPKDKILMQRAEQVCFCIVQGEWPTPKLLNSMMNLSAVGHGSGSGAMESPHRTESPASDSRYATKSAKMRGRPQSRTHFAPQNSTLDAINSSQQLLQKLTELQQVGQVSKEEAEQLHHLLTQSIMLGLPVDALMSQLTQQPNIPDQPKPTKVEKKQTKMEQQAAKITPEQQSKLMALEKQLQDPTIALLLRQGMIDPAALGLDQETAKLLGLTPVNPKAIDTKSLLNQPGMTPEVLQLMQMQGLPIPGMGGLGVPTPKKSAKKRPAPVEMGGPKNSDSRPASRSSMASGSQRAATPNDTKKRKSDDKIDLSTLPPSQIIPLIMAGSKMPEGIPNKELKGLLDSNPSITVDYENLAILLEKSRPKPKKQPPPAPAPPHASPGMPGAAELAELGLTSEVMAQLMQQGMDPTKLNLAALTKMAGKQAKANDPAHQRVQLINLSTYVKLDRKKCPELYNLESFLKKNPDYFVSTESKDFVVKHPKYFPRTMYQRIQPDMSDPLAQFSALQDPKMMQSLMMQAQMDPKAMAVLQGLAGPQQGMQSMLGVTDPKMLAALGMDKNSLAMAQLGGLDPKMLQALGAGYDPKMLGMDPKLLASMGIDPKMLPGLGCAEQKLQQQQQQQQQLQQQQQQQQQQLAMLGLQGMDSKTMQALMGGIDPKQLGALGMDPATLMALGLGGLGGGDLASLQKQQQDQHLKAMAQLMGAGAGAGAIDPKQLAALGIGAGGFGAGGYGAGGFGALPTQQPRSTTSTPKPSTPKPEERRTPKPADVAPIQEDAASVAGEGDATVNGDDVKSVKSNKSGSKIEQERGSDGSKPSSPKPGSSKSGTPRPPSTPKSNQMDKAMQNTLRSLASVDPKALAAKGIDPSMLKQLGIIGESKVSSPSVSKPQGMEGLDNETLKLLASGDPAAMNRLLQQGQLGAFGYGAGAAGLGAASNPLAALGGLDPRMLGLDERTLMALGGSGALGALGAAGGGLGGLDPKLLGAMGLDMNLMKGMGMDVNALKALQQQELMKQQQMQMAMLGMGGMGGMGGMDPKALQMLGLGGLDPKMLGGLDPATAQTLMLQQQMAEAQMAQQLRGAGSGMEQAIMQQLLAGTMGQLGKPKGTPKKSSLPTSSNATSIPTSIPSNLNLELLKQQDQQLRALVSGSLQPDQLTPELSLLAAQLGLKSHLY